MYPSIAIVSFLTAGACVSSDSWGLVIIFMIIGAISFGIAGLKGELF